MIDVAERKLVNTIPVGARAGLGEVILVQATFSPNGKWLAVITQAYPTSRSGERPTAEELAQPRVHLIEVATGEIRETLVAPQGLAAAACFSPDGKTLATTGKGCVLLWDLTRPPGE